VLTVVTEEERGRVDGTSGGSVLDEIVRDGARVDEVTGERSLFSSVILPPWTRKSPKVTEVLPLLYLHGLSSQDFAPALEGFLGSSAGCPRRRSPG
jgi:putative transposase